MTNEEIIEEYGKPENWISLSDLLDLARQDEREKMTEEKVKEYLGGLGGKEAALIVLNYLLRGGITDDDLRGLRLQWIKDEREKMQGVEVYISWDSEDAEFEPQENPCSVWADRPEYDREFGTFNESIDVAWLFNVPEEFCDTLGVDSGQCKKFRIVEELL